MRKVVRSLAAVAVAAVATGLSVGMAGSAFAAGNPPWEPVANPPEVGSIVFYNSAGQQITGGLVSSAEVAAYDQGTTTIQSGDTTATLLAYTPVNGVNPGAWSGEPLSSSTTYPNASAPGALATSPLPLVTGASTDYSLANYINDFPNADTSTDGYAGLYVLRLETDNPGHAAPTSYEATDIQVTGTGATATWSVVYPALTPVTTTTTLTTTQTSPQQSGTSIQLNASVSPSAPGTVQFEYGTGTPTPIGSPVTVSGGTASTTTTGLPVGTDSLSAVFTPAPFSDDSGSTGTDSFTISPSPAAGTTTALGVNPLSAPADTSVALTAAVTDTATSAALASGAGQVEFFDNGSSTADMATGTDLGTVSLGSGGIATLNYSLFATGDHNIVAEFLPADSTVYSSSVSAVVLFTATAPTYTPDPQTVQVGIPAGSLVITTPYGPSDPFTLGTATLDVSDAAFHASANFGGAGSQDAGNSGTTGTGGVVITDTRAGDQGWTASAEVSNFSDGATPTPDLINGQNLAFTGLTESYPTGNSLNGHVTLTNVPSTAVTNGTPYAASATGTDGLGGAAHPFATAPVGNSDGTVWIDGVLTLIAPTSTPAGTYTATLTFTIA